MITVITIVVKQCGLENASKVLLLLGYNFLIIALFDQTRSVDTS